MYTYMLLALILALLLITLKIVKGDYFFPAAIILEVYALSVFFAILEMDKWDSSISFETFNIFCTGILTYFITAIVTRMILKRTSKYRFTIGKLHMSSSSNNIVVDDEKPITISVGVCIAVVSFSLLVLIVYFRDVRISSLSVAMFDSFSEMIGNFHDNSVMGTLEVGVSAFSNYGNMILAAISYILLYINVQDIVLKHKLGFLHRLLCWFPIIIFVFCSILSGARNPILQLICAFFILYYIMSSKFKQKSRKFRWKLALRIIVAVVLVLVVFSSLRGVVGRKSDYGFIDYIAKYVGGSIKLFDIFIGAKLTNMSGIWGKETFVNVWRYIGSKTGNIEYTSLLMNKEWRSYKGFAMGNVYTAFREYYFDFKIVGVVVLTAIHAFIFTFAYQKLMNSKNLIRSNKICFPLLLYAYVSQSLFYFSIDDRLYQAYLARNVVLTVLAMYIFIKIINKARQKRT